MVKCTVVCVLLLSVQGYSDFSWACYRTGWWERQPDIGSLGSSPPRSRAAAAVRHPSQEQMVLTVGTLSVPKDTQSPAEFPPANFLPRQYTCIQLLGHQHLPRAGRACRGSRMVKPQPNAWKLAQTHSINESLEHSGDPALWKVLEI